MVYAALIEFSNGKLKKANYNRMAQSLTFKNLWYHLGLKSLSRNNLSHALKHRSSDIFEKTFYELLCQFRNERGTVKDKRFKFKMSVKSFDSTTISLCLSLFDWATFRKKKGGIKLHTMFNNKEQIPEFVNMTC